MATSAHVAPAGAGEWHPLDRRARGRGLWRQARVSWPLASPAPAVRVGVSTHLTAFRGTPRLTRPRAWPGSHRGRLASGVTAQPIAELIAGENLRWRRVHGERRDARVRRADCAAMRVTPALDHRQPRLSPEIWLLAERESGSQPKTRFFYVNLPATAASPNWCALHISGGRLSNSIRAQVRAWPRSLRRAHLPGLAPSRRPDGGRIQLPTGRASAPRPASDLSARARHCPRDLHRVSLRPATSLPQTHEARAATKKMPDRVCGYAPRDDRGARGGAFVLSAWTRGGHARGPGGFRHSVGGVPTDG